MNYFNRFLKIFLAFVMLGLALATPLKTTAYEMDEDQNYEDFLNFYNDDFYDHYEWNFDEGDFILEDEPFFDLEPAEFFDIFDITGDEAHPAITGYVPEILFVDDMLLDVDEDEIFLPIEPRNIPAAGSGLVQFVLEPVNWNTNWGTLAQARAAAFNARTIYHPLFATATAGATNTATAVNGRYGRDAIYLGQSANGNRFRIMIAGFEGYVNRVGNQHNITVPVNGVNRTFAVRANAVFVPFSNYPNNTGSTSVRSVSHYVNRNGELFRYLTNNVTGTGGFIRFLTGSAPSWMTQNTRYYSFDGVYFYRNPRNIRVNGSGAVNANNPFFNYFQYLSFRSNSNVTAAQLNDFLTNQSLHGINTSNSVMRNQGNAFINAQNRYGINALLMYAKAMHESAGGTSTIARNNNNLFGQGAIDAAPGTNAWHFATPADSVNDLANGWLSRGYLWPGDWRYEGPHVGHKGSGMNIRYATDPYWGQKIAGWAFRIDRTRSANSRDINREQIAIRQNTSSVAVTNAGGTTLYTANPRQARYFPFLVTGTSGNRLRVVTDSAIVNGVTNRTALFNRNNAIGYIPNSNVWLTGAGDPSAPQTTPQVRTISRRRTGVTVADVNFRRGPGTNYQRIRTVNANTNVRITGIQGDWYRVRHDGTTGWMHRNYVQQTRQRAVVRGNNVPVHTTRNSNSAVLTHVAHGTRIVVARRSANWSRITVNGHTGWVRNNQITMANAGRPGQVTANVNVHARPYAGSNVIRRLPRNAQVIQLQRTTNGSGVNQGWTQIQIHHANGVLTGWVRTNRVENRAHTRRVIGSGTAPLRSGPGTSFSINRNISVNTEVTLLARTSNWSRVRVRVNGRNEYGWIANNRVSRLSLPNQP